jgi:hypothetical protein
VTKKQSFRFSKRRKTDKKLAKDRKKKDVDQLFETWILIQETKRIAALSRLFGR